MNNMLFIAVDTIGIAAFALSGYLAAVRAKLDWLGVFLMAFFTALGGGIARDLLAHTTPFAFRQDYPACTVVAVTVLALALRLHWRELDHHQLFVIADAVGLSSCAITGALTALDAKLNAAGVLMLALITAVGGGALRDVILNRVPIILGSEFYGSVAILIGLAVLILHQFNLVDPVSVILILLAGVVTRIAAIRGGWRLPVPR